MTPLTSRTNRVTVRLSSIIDHGDDNDLLSGYSVSVGHLDLLYSYRSPGNNFHRHLDFRQGEKVMTY